MAFDNYVPEPPCTSFRRGSGSLGFISYGYGLSGRRRHVSTLAFALLLEVILDMDRPRRGLIRVSQESIIRLQVALEAGASADTGHISRR